MCTGAKAVEKEKTNCRGQQPQRIILDYEREVGIKTEVTSSSDMLVQTAEASKKGEPDLFLRNSLSLSERVLGEGLGNGLLAEDLRKY